MRRYSCKICKELNEEDHKKGVLGKYKLLSLLDYSGMKEAREHMKRVHPEIYAKIMKKKQRGAL